MILLSSPFLYVAVLLSSFSISMMILSFPLICVNKNTESFVLSYIIGHFFRFACERRSDFAFPISDSCEYDIWDASFSLKGSWRFFNMMSVWKKESIFFLQLQFIITVDILNSYTLNSLYEILNLRNRYRNFPRMIFVKKQFCSLPALIVNIYIL